MRDPAAELSIGSESLSAGAFPVRGRCAAPRHWAPRTAFAARCRVTPEPHRPLASATRRNREEDPSYPDRSTIHPSPAIGRTGRVGAGRPTTPAADRRQLPVPHQRVPHPDDHRRVPDERRTLARVIQPQSPRRHRESIGRRAGHRGARLPLAAGSHQCRIAVYREPPGGTVKKARRPLTIQRSTVRGPGGPWRD